MRLLKDQDLSNKNVVVRLDLNVPIQDKQILDSTRIISSVPTIKYLVNKNCKVLLTSHLGRPKEGKFDQDFSMSCLLYTSPSPRDAESSRMPSSA